MRGSVIKCGRCHAGPEFLLPHEIGEDAEELPLLTLVTCGVCKFTFTAKILDVSEMMDKLNLPETNGRTS